VPRADVTMVRRRQFRQPAAQLHGGVAPCLEQARQRQPLLLERQRRRQWHDHHDQLLIAQRIDVLEALLIVGTLPRSAGQAQAQPGQVDQRELKMMPRRAERSRRWRRGGKRWWRRRRTRGRGRRQPPRTKEGKPAHRLTLRSPSPIPQKIVRLKMCQNARKCPKMPDRKSIWQNEPTAATSG